MRRLRRVSLVTVVVASSLILLTGTSHSADSRFSHVAISPGAAVNDGAIDLYGNAVIDAVATYELDQEGSLYEVHSPQTEMPPRLKSPST
jgi:hypothetical protein